MKNTILLFTLALSSLSSFASAPTALEENQTVAELASENPQPENSILPERMSLYFRSFVQGQGIDTPFGILNVEDLEKPNLGLDTNPTKAVADFGPAVLNDGPFNMEVVVVVPKDLSPAVMEEYLGLIKGKIQTAYPQANVKLQPTFSDPETIQREMAEDNATIEQELIQSPNSTQETKNLGRFLISLNQAKSNLYQVAKTDVVEFLKNERTKNPKKFDDRFTNLVGIIKSGSNAAAWWISSTNKGAIAAICATTSALMDWWFARYGNFWNTYKQTSLITWKRFGFGRIAKFFNQSEARRSWFIDQALGLTANQFFRTMAHLDDPKVSPVYSEKALLDFWAPYAVSFAVGGPIGAKSQEAINNLRRKGVFTMQHQRYAFLGFDLFFALNSFLLQKNQLWAYGLFQLTEWTIRLGYVSANVVSPAAYKKLVLVDPRVPEKDLPEVLYREGIIIYDDAHKNLTDWNDRVESTKLNEDKQGKIDKLLGVFEDSVKSTHSNWVAKKAAQIVPSCNKTFK